MRQSPTIIHNGTPYNADLDMFLYLSPLLQNLYSQNSYNRPMYITDGLKDHDFQVLVTSINNRNCLNVINTNSVDEIFSFLQSCLVYHIHQFIEDSCQFIINRYKKYIVYTLKLISQYEETSNNLDQYIISNMKSLCKKQQFFTIDYFNLKRLLEMKNRKSDISKDPDIVSFIIHYVKDKQSKEFCFLFQFTNFQTIYDIDGGVLLEELINKDLIDFDFLGEKIMKDLKKGNSAKNSSSNQNSNSSNKKLASKQIELLEAKIVKTAKECKIESDKIGELKAEQKNLQSESSKVESTLNTVTKQSLNASSKIALLQKEKAELEQKLAALIQEEEESKQTKYEDEEPEKANETNNKTESNTNSNSQSATSNVKNKQTNPQTNEKSVPQTKNEQSSQQQQQSEGPSMPYWCPKAKLTPPENQFNEDKFYSNIQKVDKEMKIYPTEALKSCFSIFNIDINDDDNISSKLDQIDSNDRATMFDFLARYSIEFNQPEIAASLAALLAAIDNSSDDLAASLFLGAADKNVPEAILNVGVMARLGRGVIQDDKMAAHMIVKAANIGLNEAISIVKAACA